LADLKLPYSYGILYRNGLIPEGTDSLTVMRVMLKLIRIPVIAKRRALGLSIENILEQMSERSLQRLRNALKGKKK
jgi:hypothetical protein